MKENKKGISLIVLVITIIVMIILASAVIISLTNTNIVAESSKAVFKSDMQHYKTMYEIYKANCILDQNCTDDIGDVFGDNLDAKYEGKLSVVNGRLTYETVDADELDVLAELDMVSKWEIQKDKYGRNIYVRKGNVTLTVGETIEYTDENGAQYRNEANTEDVVWKVLGADEKGNLLIVSQKTVKTYQPQPALLLPSAENPITVYELEELMDAECNGYLNEQKGAVKARSIRVEDIDRITQYVKNYKDGIEEYGLKITVSWKANTTNTLQYFYEGMEAPKVLYKSNGFYYPDEDGYLKVSTPSTSNEDKEIFTVDTNYYKYSINDCILAKESEDIPNDVQQIYTNVCTMFFDNEVYWLPSFQMTAVGHTNVEMDGVMYSFRRVADGWVKGASLMNSAGDIGTTAEYGVRAVVELSPNVKIDNTNAVPSVSL